MMAQGTIAHLSGCGCGFIDCGTGRVLFFYGSDVEHAPFDALRLGDRVEFDTKCDALCPSDRATRVRRVDAREAVEAVDKPACRRHGSATR